MGKNLFWTEKIPLGTIRDPLQLAVFRYPEEYFISGIITQTERLRYYTFLTWAWNQIKNRNSKFSKNEIRDLEKILSLSSASHHRETDDAPNGIRSRDTAKEFLQENEQVILDKFTNFGRKNQEGWGNYYYKGSLKTLDLIWEDKDGKIMVSPAAEEITKIFSKYTKNIENIIWSKSISKSDLDLLHPICCCSLTKEEQNFWRMVFFGMTSSEKNGLQIIPEKQLEISNPDDLSFEKFQISEDMIDDSDMDYLITDFGDIKEDITAKTMRTGSLLMILKIINDSKPTTEKTPLLQKIRDCIYYSQFQNKDSIDSIIFGKIDWYQKYWEVYVHNLYYIGIFEWTLSQIIEITQTNPLGIKINQLTNEIIPSKILDIFTEFGLDVDKSDTIQIVYEKLTVLFDNKKTTLNNNLNEHNLLIKIIQSQDATEGMGLTILLFLLCKYRYSFFDEKQLQILSYKHEKFVNVSPEYIYESSEKISITEFPKWIFKFVIKRHRHASAKKLLNSGTRAWLFTEEDDELFFNKEYWFNAYRDGKWRNVLEILHDLGLVKKNSAEKLWEITKDGEDWLKRIQ